jgi:hypothetical protein
VIAPIVQMFRQSVNHVFLPSMSRMHSTGDFGAMLALNSRANAMVALLVYPCSPSPSCSPSPLITLVYTPTYANAAPVMRLYIVGLLALVVELTSILFLLKQGGFSTRVNALVLALALPLSYFGAITWGIVGAALGSVVALFSERALTLARISALTAPRGVQAAGLDVARRHPRGGGIAGLAPGRCCVHAPHSSFSRSRRRCDFAVVYPLALFLTGQRRPSTASSPRCGIPGRNPPPSNNQEHDMDNNPNNFPELAAQPRTGWSRAWPASSARTCSSRC